MILQGSLGNSAFERSIKELVTTDSKTEVVFNLRNITFIEPYGLIGLITAARYCNSQLGIRPQIVPPPRKIATYMNRMNFFNTFRNYGDFHKGLLLSLPSRRDSPLLEVSKLEFVSNWAVVDIAGSLMNRMVMILSRETSLKRALIHKIGINIVEICENVYHSKDMGYVAVQRYEYPQPMVKVGIMDLGIGIAASLEKRYKTLRPSWSDLDAIKLSIEPDVTSREGGGGLGLTQLSKFIRDEAHGLLSIRSGTGKLVISNAGTNREYSDLTYFPGTQIDMTIPIG